MEIKKLWEKKREKLGFSDYVMMKLSCIAFGVLLVALFPLLVSIDIWWIAAIFVILAAKPLYAVFSK